MSFLRDVVAEEPDVVGDRAGDQVRLLRHERDLAAHSAATAAMSRRPRERRPWSGHAGRAAAGPASTCRCRMGRRRRPPLAARSCETVAAPSASPVYTRTTRARDRAARPRRSASLIDDAGRLVPIEFVVEGVEERQRRAERLEDVCSPGRSCSERNMISDHCTDRLEVAASTGRHCREHRHEREVGSRCRSAGTSLKKRSRSGRSRVLVDQVVRPIARLGVAR